MQPGWESCDLAVFGAHQSGPGLYLCGIEECLAVGQLPRLQVLPLQGWQEQPLVLSGCRLFAPGEQGELLLFAERE